MIIQFSKTTPRLSREGRGVLFFEGARARGVPSPAAFRQLEGSHSIPKPSSLPRAAASDQSTQTNLLGRGRNAAGCSWPAGRRTITCLTRITLIVANRISEFVLIREIRVKIPSYVSRLKFPGASFLTSRPTEHETHLCSLGRLGSSQFCFACVVVSRGRSHHRG